MNRSLQEIVELVIFGIIAVAIATGLLWVLGHVLRVVGFLSTKIAGWIWRPVSFLLLIAIIVIAVYFIWKFIQDRNTAKAAKPASVISSDSGNAKPDAKSATAKTTKETPAAAPSASTSNVSTSSADKPDSNKSSSE